MDTYYTGFVRRTDIKESSVYLMYWFCHKTIVAESSGYLLYWLCQKN